MEQDNEGQHKGDEVKRTKEQEGTQGRGKWKEGSLGVTLRDWAAWEGCGVRMPHFSRHAAADPHDCFELTIAVLSAAFGGDSSAESESEYSRADPHSGMPVVQHSLFRFAHVLPACRNRRATGGPQRLASNSFRRGDLTGARAVLDTMEQPARAGQTLSAHSTPALPPQFTRTFRCALYEWTETGPATATCQGQRRQHSPEPHAALLRNLGMQRGMVLFRHGPEPHSGT
eukprot:356979-Chlamydomonas_euryale.AAC.7